MTPVEIAQQGILYTPSAPGLSEAALRAELDSLGELTPGQVDTVLAHAAEDGQLVSIIRASALDARGCLRFQTLEAATGLTYEHKLEPNGRAWHAGRADLLNT